MSFQDVGRKSKPRPAASPDRGGLGSAPSGGDDPAAGGGYERLSDSIVQYQKNVASLEKIARSIGTPNDTSASQTQYSLRLDATNRLSARIGADLSALERRLAALPRPAAAALRARHAKLVRDYGLVERQFECVRSDARKRRSAVAAEADGTRDGGRLLSEEERRKSADEVGERNDGEEVGRQMQIREDRINEEIMREREEEIRNIHKGMHQVNEIYKDLAQLVDNQQEGIDTVETQMENAKDNTATGLKHIEKANQHQQSQCVVS